MEERSKALTCHFKNENDLLQSYMPFLKDGGLFIRTKYDYELEDKITLIITLFDDPEVYTIESRVVWITPKGAQGNKSAGIGLQFLSENKRQVCNKIETYLAGRLKSVTSTDTM